MSVQSVHHFGKLLTCATLVLVLVGGCHFRKSVNSSGAAACVDCQTSFTQIEYPDLCDQGLENTSAIRTHAPPNLENFAELEQWPLTLEYCIETALANSQVLQRLGGAVLQAPQAVATVYDTALLETDPFRSAEAALSAFDTQFQGTYRFDHREQGIANPLAEFQGGVNAGGVFNTTLSKTTATGAAFNISNLNNYNYSDSVFAVPPSTWQTQVRAEWRQPLARGFGTAVNRIAGPNATPGVYDGVLIARIRGDLVLADFETAVRDLVLSVEQSYWELYFAWRSLDVATRTRESARLIWDNRKRRVDAGLSRPDDEAQARQQYFTFSQLVVDSLTGNKSGQTGVLGSERNLRRLMGLLNTDGRMIRPITEPTIAPILFDWEQSEQLALSNRVEIRKQKWVVRQRELEVFAARKLNQWRADFVGNYAFKGFNDELFGSEGAVKDFFEGNLDDWGVGFEVLGPVGRRRGHLATRNAELRLIREKTVLREQQRQLLMDLNAAIAEVERSYEGIKNNFNSSKAVLAELKPKAERVAAGDEDVFFLLDTQQRAARAESDFHRAVVDYNLALQQYVFTTGSLLEHYNIQLVEGEWSQAAQADAFRKDKRFRYGAVNPNKMANYPISAGPVDQTTDLTTLSMVTEAPNKTPGAANAPIDGFSPPEVDNQ